METSAMIRRALLTGSNQPMLAGQSGSSKRRGEGYEFAELRQYVNGDDPRRIDWAATARVGVMQTKVMLDEHALFLVSILDESASMKLGRKRTRIAVARDALLLWNQACRTGDRCMAAGEKTFFEARGASPETAAHACAEHSLGTVDVETTLRHADFLAPRGSALLFIIDPWSKVEEATLFRVASRHNSTVLYARDPWFDGMPLRGFVRVRDANTGRVERIFADAKFEQRYIEAITQKEIDARRLFEKAGWRFSILTDNADESMRNAFLPIR